MLTLALVELVVTALISGLVGFAAGAAFMFATTRGAEPAPSPRALPGGGPDPLLPGSIQDARKGALLSVGGFGDEYEDVHLEVERYTRFSRGREEWHELQSTYKNRPVALFWQEERGALQVWACKRLRAAGLEALGLSPSALASLKKGGSHARGGETWNVAEAGTALSHENGIGFGKELACWELVRSDGKQAARIERWGDDAPQVSLLEPLDPGMIEVFRTRG